MNNNIKEIQDKLTPIPTQQLLYSLANNWKKKFNEFPKKESLLVLLAQITLETGANCKFAHNYNLGNIKAKKTGDTYYYSYYKCNEILDLKMAQKMIENMEKDGGKVEISKVNGNIATVWFFPNHYACKFRAFENLEEGVEHHLDFLKNRYNPESGIWDSIIQGSPSLFAHRLKLARYYTADESLYLKGVQNLYDQFKKLEYNIEKINESTDYENQQIINNVILNIDNWARNEDW